MAEPGDVVMDPLPSAGSVFDSSWLLIILTDHYPDGAIKPVDPDQMCCVKKTVRLLSLTDQ